MAAHLDLRVIELLSSKLCHDLISPVGAVNNGVELISELGEDMQDEAFGLIAQSAEQAARRLRTYRIAYGAISGKAVVAAGEARRVGEGYVAERKGTLVWPSEQLPDSAELTRSGAKVLMSAIMLAADGWAANGRLEIAAEPALGRWDLSLKATGRGAGLSAEVIAAFNGNTQPADLTPRTVHAFFTGRVAEGHGVPIELTSETGELVLVKLKLPRS